MCRFHMLWSLWDTDTLWLCVITWSCIAWIAFVSAFTQPTWNTNRRIAEALMGERGTEEEEEGKASRRRKSRWRRRLRILPKTPQFPHRHPTAEYKQMWGMPILRCARVRTRARARARHVYMRQRARTDTHSSYTDWHARFPLAKLPAVFAFSLEYSESRSSRDFTRANKRTHAHTSASYTARPYLD